MRKIPYMHKCTAGKEGLFRWNWISWRMGWWEKTWKRPTNCPSKQTYIRWILRRWCLSWPRHMWMVERVRNWICAFFYPARARIIAEYSINIVERECRSKYEGDWENGLPNGNGSYTAHDGGKVEGVWKNGLVQGQCQVVLFSQKIQISNPFW